jgi:hypothetical protein
MATRSGKSEQVARSEKVEMAVGETHLKWEPEVRGQSGSLSISLFLSQP